MIATQSVIISIDTHQLLWKALLYDSNDDNDVNDNNDNDDKKENNSKHNNDMVLVLKPNISWIEKWRPLPRCAWNYMTQVGTESDWIWLELIFEAQHFLSWDGTSQKPC